MTGADAAPPPPALVAPAPGRTAQAEPRRPWTPDPPSAPDVIFEDEFDRAPDEPGSPWMTTYFWGGRTLPTNKEEQFYLDRNYRPPSGLPQPFRPFEIRDGMLVIRAERIPPERRGDFGGLAYASGLITTWKSFAFTYGRVEVRAKFPSGKGLWPAIWLLRRDSGKNGEIDIVEMLGHRPDFMTSTLHYPEGGVMKSDKLLRLKGPELGGRFRVYELEWTAEHIVIRLDGEELARRPTPEAFKRPMYLLVNLAVGGQWPGPPDAATVFPAEMLIDYVRIRR